MELSELIDVSVWLKPVVYVLINRGTVVYVGKTAQPIIRLFQHKLKAGEVIYKRRHTRGVERFPFDKILFHPCDHDQLDRMEKLMIQKHQPKHNILHKYEPLDIKALLATIVPIRALSNDHPTIGKINRRI